MKSWDIQDKKCRDVMTWEFKENPRFKLKGLHNTLFIKQVKALKGLQILTNRFLQTWQRL